MLLLMSIRIAEAWTPSSVTAFVVIGVALASLIAWLIYRS